VIVNQVTPPHRDSGGCPTHYDLLVSAGTHTKAELSVPDWGHLSYSLEMLWHVAERCFAEVADWSGGERVCALIMKDNVHECLEVLSQLAHGRGLLVFGWKIDLEIEPHIYLFIFKVT